MATFLGEPPVTVETQAAYDDDRRSDGYVWNNTRLWTWRPDLAAAFAALRTNLMETSALIDRDSAVLVASAAAAPDKQLADAAPDPVRAAVDYGRPLSPEPSQP
jgi:hypothetical protein